MSRAARLLALLLAVLWLAAGCVQAEEQSWYMQQADALVAELYELVSDEEYVGLFTGSAQMEEKIGAWREAMAHEPTRVSGFDIPDMEDLMELTAGETAGLSQAAQKHLERRLPAMFISAANGMEGVEFLAAASVVVLSEGYVMPEDFGACIVLYEYEGISVCVSFAETGEGVVLATAQFCTPRIAELLGE